MSARETRLPALQSRAARQTTRLLNGAQSAKVAKFKIHAINLIIIVKTMNWIQYSASGKQEQAV
jgi:hypothetical protein